MHGNFPILPSFLDWNIFYLLKYVVLFTLITSILEGGVEYCQVNTWYWQRLALSQAAVLLWLGWISWRVPPLFFNTYSLSPAPGPLCCYWLEDFSETSDMPKEWVLMGPEASGRAEHPAYCLRIPDTWHIHTVFSLELESVDSDLGPSVLAGEGSLMPMARSSSLTLSYVHFRAGAGAPLHPG